MPVPSPGKEGGAVVGDGCGLSWADNWHEVHKYHPSLLVLGCRWLRPSRRILPLERRGEPFILHVHDETRLAN